MHVSRRWQDWLLGGSSIDGSAYPEEVVVAGLQHAPRLERMADLVRGEATAERGKDMHSSV